MRVPAKSDYALRASLALARHDGTFVTSAALSDEEGIPREYLQNILSELVRGGLVVAQRGHDGGYRLARPAHAITIADVLVAVESPLVAPHDVPAHRVWDALETSTNEVLVSVTLADARRPRGRARGSAAPDC